MTLQPYNEQHIKNCQRHNRPKELSTLTQSTPELQQALKSWSRASNPCHNFEESMLQIREIQVAILTNPCNNIEKSNNSIQHFDFDSTNT